jgi:hypothetical protein
VDELGSRQWCKNNRGVGGSCIVPSRTDVDCQSWPYKHSAGCKIAAEDGGSCSAMSGKWIPKATNATQCAVAKACDVNGVQSMLNPKDCSTCGGTSVPMYKWLGGTVIFNKNVTLFRHI